MYYFISVLDNTKQQKTFKIGVFFLIIVVAFLAYDMYVADFAIVKNYGKITYYFLLFSPPLILTFFLKKSTKEEKVYLDQYAIESDLIGNIFISNIIEFDITNDIPVKIKIKDQDGKEVYFSKAKKGKLNNTSEFQHFRVALQNYIDSSY